ncbi:cation:proton antiporter [Synechococcus sp. CS-603]|nr:cation:proton antiporter [Synechococcus sp. CS-603]
MLAVFGALLLVAVLLDTFAFKVRVPGILLVLALGLLTDNNLEAIPGGAKALLSLARAEEVAQVALVLVLFFGGLTTNWARVLSIVKPATRLATAGSLITALLVMVAVLGFQSLPGSLLPTSLPLALASAGGAATAPSGLVIDVVRQFLLGGLLGFLGGSLAQQLLSTHRRRVSPSVLAVMSLAELMLVVGVTQLLGGSGLLAAFIVGLVLGNSPTCDQPAMEEAQAGFAKMAELMLFLCMGLVVDPQEVVQALPWSFALFLVMLLARSLMVQGMLLGSPFGQAEKTFVGLAGLRGAVPIAMAIQAAASDVSWGRLMPSLALGVVLMGLLFQGFALVPLARRLGLTTTSAVLHDPYF